MGSSKELKIGLALQALAMCCQHACKTIHWNVTRLEKYIDSNQVFIHMDSYGQLAGLVIWANVSGPVNQKLLMHGLDALQIDEISSGNETWLIELYAPCGSLPLLLKIMKDKILKASNRLTYFRIKNGKRIAKQIARSDCTSFFRYTPPIPSIKDNFLLSKKRADFRQSAVEAHDSALRLGEVVKLACHLPYIGDMPLHLALGRLTLPGKLRQQRIYRDDDGQVCGYIAWAWLEAELAFRNTPQVHTMGKHQWNEGNCMLICDAFATASGLVKVCTDLSTGLYPNETMYLRPDTPSDTNVQSISISADALADLYSIYANVTPVIDILALLQKRLTNHDAAHL
jgi:hemolysin-activating ACP:hemolysin acyltransferase